MFINKIWKLNKEFLFIDLIKFVKIYFVFRTLSKIDIFMKYFDWKDVDKNGVMMKITKIAVFTSGGDAPGMNACIRAIVRKAMHSNIEVVGALRGYDGMINNDFIQLDKSSVGNIIQKGGTILKTARSIDFITVQGRKKAFENIQNNNIEEVDYEELTK